MEATGVDWRAVPTAHSRGSLTNLSSVTPRTSGTSRDERPIRRRAARRTQRGGGDLRRRAMTTVAEVQGTCSRRVHRSPSRVVRCLALVVAAPEATQPLRAVHDGTCPEWPASGPFEQRETRRSSDVVGIFHNSGSSRPVGVTRRAARRMGGRRWLRQPFLQAARMLVHEGENGNRGSRWSSHAAAPGRWPDQPRGAVRRPWLRSCISLIRNLISTWWKYRLISGEHR